MTHTTSAPHRSYRICTRCVMDTTDPWIRFHPDGTCNHCSEFLGRRLSVTAYQKDPTSGDRLGLMLERIRSDRKPADSHDVVIGVSGGVDSTSTVLLAQEAGLRVLAVHMDNGWDTSIAIRNVLRVAALPGIDYQSEVLHWNGFKAVQRAFIDAGVPDIELPTDIAIQSVLHRVAGQQGIRTILSGGTIANEGILPAAWLYNARDSLYAHSIVDRAGLPRSLYAPIRFGFREELRCRLQRNIRTLYPLNQFSYDKESARQKLQQQIGWQSYGGKHCESTFTRFTQLIYLPQRHQADYRRGYLSADICLGKTSRVQALAGLQRAPWEDLDVSHDIAFVARKLDYTVPQLEAELQAPPRWYRDFPNRERLLGLLYNGFRMLTRRQKASNF